MQLVNAYISFSWQKYMELKVQKTQAIIFSVLETIRKAFAAVVDSNAFH